MKHAQGGGIRVVTKQEGQKQESPHEAGFLLIHSYQKKTVNRYLVHSHLNWMIKPLYLLVFILGHKSGHTGGHTRACSLSAFWAFLGGLLKSLLPSLQISLANDPTGLVVDFKHGLID